MSQAPWCALLLFPRPQSVVSLQCRPSITFMENCVSESSVRADAIQDRMPDVPATVLLRLGPGLITGAADDDPSGIATYSQVGAQFGFGMLWTMLFSYPLMAAIQEICARLGRITGVGIAANLKRCYSKRLVYC